MKKRKMIMRRIVAVLLALVMIGSAVDMSGVTVHAEETVVDSGFCGAEGDGTNLTWQVTENGETYTLTISGTGAMADSAPWYGFRNEITTVIIDEGVTSIAPGAFYYFEVLKGISIPSGVTSIGSQAFAYCRALETVSIPLGVTNIGERAFDNCTSLTSVVLPEGVESIGVCSFASCTSLETINFPSTITSIGISAFDNCDALASVVLPEGVTSVGKLAFRNCNALETVSIPSSLTNIPDSMFENCTSLANVTISKGVTSIGWTAFSGCDALTSVIIPEGVTSIGRYAFADNDLLAEITIPSSVENIGYDAFARCPNLQTVHVPCNWDTENPLYDFGNINVQNSGCDSTNRVYVAKGATLTGTCGACNKDEGSLTLVSPSGLTYDGNEKQATITGSINGVENPTITYNTTDGSAPIYPGNYTTGFS